MCSSSVLHSTLSELCHWVFWSWEGCNACLGAAAGSEAELTCAPQPQPGCSVLSNPKLGLGLLGAVSIPAGLFWLCSGHVPGLSRPRPFLWPDTCCPWAGMLRCMASSFSPWDSLQGYIVLLLALGVLAGTDTCLSVPDRMFLSFLLLKQTQSCALTPQG